MEVFLSRPPLHPRLIGLVDRVWWTAPECRSGVSEEWVMPTCRAQIIFAPEASSLVGPKVAAERIERRLSEPMVGVSLVAGATSAFVGASGSDLCGATVSLDALLPVGSRPDLLAECGGAAALGRVEAEMVDRLGDLTTDPAVQAVERAIREGQAATAAIAEHGLDRRTFVPDFHHAVGVTPKRYERICRFNRAVAAVRHVNAKPLASIAAAHGFADQAHMTREIRHFARTKPSLMHRDGTNMVNHLEPEKIEPDKIFKT